MKYGFRGTISYNKGKKRALVVALEHLSDLLIFGIFAETKKQGPRLMRSMRPHVIFLPSCVAGKTVQMNYARTYTDISKGI